MNTHPELSNSVKVPPVLNRFQGNVSRQNGSIRGVILNTKTVNLDQLFGFTRTAIKSSV
jgi:hypothetical protein